MACLQKRNQAFSFEAMLIEMLSKLKNFTTISPVPGTFFETELDCCVNFVGTVAEQLHFAQLCYFLMTEFVNEGDSSILHNRHY